MASTVSKLQAELDSLRSEIKEHKLQATAQANQIVQENNARLRELRLETQRQLKEDRAETQKRFEGVLVGATRQQETAVKNAGELLKRRYDELNEQLQKAIEAESAEIDAVKKEQAEFEAEYRAAQERKRQTAFKTIEEAKQRVESFEENYPVEWFLPGRCSLYRGRLLYAADLLSQEIYEAAAGIASNLILSIDIDETELILAYKKWVLSFSVLAEIIKTEHNIITCDSRILEGFGIDYYDMMGIANNRIDDELLKFWIDSDFFEIRENHNLDYDLVYGILGESIFSEDSDEITEFITEFLNNNPELSGKYTPDLFYFTLRSAEERFAQLTRLVCRMRSRFKAHQERAMILGDLSNLMEDCGFESEAYSCEYKDNDERKSIIVAFSDSGAYMSVEVHIIPILSDKDDRWYNCIGYKFLSESTDYDTEKELRNAFSEYFEDILVITDESNDRKTLQHRNDFFTRQFKQSINGHL